MTDECFASVGLLRRFAQEAEAVMISKGMPITDVFVREFGFMIKMRDHERNLTRMISWEVLSSMPLAVVPKIFENMLAEFKKAGEEAAPVQDTLRLIAVNGRTAQQQLHQLELFDSITGDLI